MADNRGNPSGSNTNMPNGVTRPKNTQDTQVSKGVLEAISNILGTPLKTIQSNTSKNVKSTDNIKKELLKFTKKLPNDSKNINDKKKKDLMNFSDKKGNEEKIKESKLMIKSLMNGTSRLFKGFTKTVKNVFDKNKDSLQGLLGPLNLILSPIQDFLGDGIFGKVFTTLGNGIKGIFGKFKKKNPNVNDVAKSGAFGIGSLYIVNEIKKIFGKDDKKNGILGNIPIIGKLIPSLTSLLKSIPILGTFLRGFSLLGKSFGKNALGKGGSIGKFFKSGATKTAFKAMGPMMIVTSLFEMAIDGIKAFFKSKEWGTSKISSVLGGFLGGASEGGLKNAFSSMGKWALLGAGIGSVVPVVGTIAGGLIGGAIGLIFGGIGGKNIAKGFDFIWRWFKNTFIPSFLEMLDDLFAISKFKEIFKGDDSIGKKIGKAIGLFFVTCFKMPIKLFTSTSTFFKKIFNGKQIQESLGNMVSSVFNGFGNAWESIKGFGSNLKDKTKNAWNSVKEFSGDVWEGIKESELASFVSSLFTSLKDGISKFFKENPVGKWIDSCIINPIKNAFTQMGAWFSYIGDAFEKDGIKGALNAMTFGMLKKDKESGLTDYEIYKQNLLNPIEVNDAIIRTDGSIIKTNPKDTLVALKDIPLSINKVRDETNKNLNGSLSQMERDGTLENKLTTIIDVLFKILEKDLQVQLPPQTRSDLDLLMQGALV